VNKTNYILINRLGLVTYVTVINQVNIMSDHRMVVSNIKVDVDVEIKMRRTIKRRSRVDTKTVGSEKIKLQLELQNRVVTLQEE